jgi:hypothetical protein
MRRMLGRIRAALATWWAQDGDDDFWDRQW